MNTPSHLAASFLVWRREDDWSSVSAVALGALLPDLPMFGFYVYQRMWAGRSESEIWSRLYFDERWQLFFDLFNSIPLALIFIVLFRAIDSRGGQLLAASALLHMICDLPLHHDDAHRHFLPLFGWRFQSPVSYWDPKHYGLYVAVGELFFALSACSFVAWKSHGRPMRTAALVTFVLYLVGIAFALVAWVF